MTVGLVVVTFRCKADVLRCLDSARRWAPELLAHTVVVDNASADGTAEAVRSAFPEVCLVENARNLGFAAAANIGLALLRSSCDAILLLNPDAELQDAGVRDAASFLAERGEYGVLGLRVENPDGSVQLSCRRFPGHLNAFFNRHSLLTKLAPGNRWSREYLLSDWAHDEIRDVDWVSGAAMLIHRRALDAVGLLDPDFFFSIEDVDFCRRVWGAGLKVGYFPGATVRHRIGGSSSRAPVRAMVAHHLGMWRYYRKHYPRRWWLDAATAAGIGSRLALHLASHAVRRAAARVRR